MNKFAIDAYQFYPYVVSYLKSRRKFYKDSTHENLVFTTSCLNKLDLVRDMNTYRKIREIYHISDMLEAVLPSPNNSHKTRREKLKYILQQSQLIAKLTRTEFESAA